MREILFFFDIVCPYAYTATTLINELSLKLNVRFIWRPVLLGGLYQATEAPQGAAGSATDPMSNSKRMYSALDLARTLKRYRVPYKEGVGPTQRTLNAMRLLTSIPDQNTMILLAHRLFNMYWYEGRDMTSIANLQEATNDQQIPIDVISNIEQDRVKEELKTNTNSAAEMGVFGVPTFQLDGKLFFGVDSIPRLAAKLGSTYVQPLRLCTHTTITRRVRLTFFYDYASPWSFFAFSQLDKVLKSVSPIQVNVEFVPVLTGGIFRTLNAPTVPVTVMPKAKVSYYMGNMMDTSEYLKLPYTYSSHFPLRSLLALRADIVSGHNIKLMTSLFSAAWQRDLDISKQEIVSDLVEEAGLNSSNILTSAQTDSVKSQLRANNERAVACGAFGVPTFQVDNGRIVWGQDRLNIVEDLLCGWTDVDGDDNSRSVKSKL
ncbi:hypothetical protein LOD99_1326 [Oopsacas minuta]|uniref:DSBA-like thioredoxin domain-containing protein n=1 Tax=Oopsacas minuta TaxID=111878 RepID=A0AAV7K783_9METZ|nr:hypothetical protein LOD99_1326 [Oopsacas minuta]